MGKLREYWRSLFDIRTGEGWRVWYMGLYLLLVLFAYYILKPVSRGMFLFRFDIDELPYLYILIAAAGGVMAYVYTKIAINSSLKRAVDYSTAFLAATLVLIWYLLAYEWPWLLYFFNAFVSLFSITLVSQGWMVAANIFTTREAKRVYGILGLGAVLGAAFGGTFTAMVVHFTGTRNLLLASVACVVLAWLCYRQAIRQPEVHVDVSRVRGAEEEETFSLNDVVQGVKRHRHLQVIIAIIALTFIVDVTVEYQFNAMAKERYDDSQRELVAFLGQFFGIWLNLATFVFQAFLTAFVISRFGVGGALQIMPGAISIASLFTFASPSVLSTAAARLTEAATRYTFNRTGMELLYLPLPADLRNRTKAFTDIFVDRFARGIGGMLLILLTQFFNLNIRQLSLVVLAYCGVWIVLSIRARNEYVATVRKRLELGRLDLDQLRINVNDAATIRLLEQTLETGMPRQAVYALSLLAETRGYHLQPKLAAALDSAIPEVRGKAFSLARETGLRGYSEKALAEIRSVRAGDNNPAIGSAVEYAIFDSQDPAELASRLLTHPNAGVAETAMIALAAQPAAAEKLITKEWIDESRRSPDTNRRVLAAMAIRIRPTEADPGALYSLLRDAEPRVAAAACRTAGALQDRTYLDGLLRLLPNARLRSHAMEALTSYGGRIVGMLGDILLDTTVAPSVRRQIPRVLRNIPSQRSVDVLLAALDEQDLTVRYYVLKSLNRLRETNPKLNFGRESVPQQILNEARYYYQMRAALEPFKGDSSTPAARLLVETVEERLQRSIERLFRLLGLRYPPREIYAAYLAVHRRKSEQLTAAVEFLDNVLEREVKRIVLPLLDDDTRATQVGREMFGVAPLDAEKALRELMRSGDSWLVACAVATAAELNIGKLRPEIEPLARKAGTEVGPVAEAALAAMTS